MRPPVPDLRGQRVRHVGYLLQRDTRILPLRRIQILGVNDIGLESGNSSMTAGRVLPLLQPATGEDVWTLWQVEYRDVVILGPGNEQLDTFNLTVNDLSDPEHYAALKNHLLEAANE